MKTVANVSIQRSTGLTGAARYPWLLALAVCSGGPLHHRAAAGEIIHAGDGELQAVVDRAPAHAEIHCDPNRQYVLSAPVVMRKPAILTGLRARLPEKLGNTSLLMVEAHGVAVTDFELTGNADSVPQSERAPLMVIHASDFRVERGNFLNSSKDGVMIDGEGAKEDIAGGVVRDITGRGVVRDVVSISGGSGSGRRIRHVLVDNVRCYDSRLRGAVEVSDGTDHVTVRKVYAESAVYALDVQDHNQAGQSNLDVLIDDVTAVRCKHAVRTANTGKGHANLTLRNVTARQCEIPVQVSHTANVHISNVRLLDHESGKPPVQINHCRGLFIRDVIAENVTVKGPAISLENCDETLVDGFTLRGQKNALAGAIRFRITATETFAGLRITNVSARGLAEPGIVLETGGKQPGTLTDYLITGNLTTVEDRLHGERGTVK